MECKCLWIDKGKPDNRWHNRTYHSSNYIGKVTIYPTSRNKMMEIDQEAFHKLFIISEKSLYFTLSSLGIPKIVCKGWIVDIDANDYNKFAKISIEHYLDQQIVYKTKNVNTYRGYSHYVKPNKARQKRSKPKEQPVLRMTLRSRSNRKNIDTKAENDNDIVPESSPKTKGRKRKLSDTEDVEQPQPRKKRRRAPRRKRNSTSKS